MASLVAGGTLETPLLKFDSFTYLFPSGPAASTINVSAVTFAAASQGLTFDAPFSFTTFAQGSIGYRVTGKSGSMLNSASLAGNPAAGSGSNFVNVNEAFSGGVPQLSIFSQSGTSSTSDMNTFSPRTGVTVSTTLQFNGAIGNPSTLSYLEELFGVATAHGADFDKDGEVDGRDFLTWQCNLGLTGAVTQQGDANGDGNVNDEDLAIWQNTFGPLSPVQSVPEPSGAAAAWAGLIGMLNVRRRKRAG